MMEFSDYQCPSCAQAQSIVKDLLGRHKSRLKVAFRHYPLQTHRWARLAALAAETAGVQGKFWEFSEKLFETQKEWGASDNARPHFIRFAQELGLDMERFERELDSARWDGLIQQDLIEGVARQVSSTPTFFIGERRLVGGSQLQANADRLIELLEMP
jgi:protein-disulfide isomerase